MKYITELKLYFLLSIALVVFSGCGTTKIACTPTIPDSVSKIGCDKPFIVGKTTKDEVQEKLGGTIFSYKKPDNVTKLVYINAEEVSIASRAFAGKKGNSIKLELWFNDNNILIKKKYTNDPKYIHPEMMETYSDAMKQAPTRPAGGYGSVTTPVGAVGNMFKTPKEISEEEINK